MLLNLRLNLLLIVFGFLVSNRTKAGCPDSFNDSNFEDESIPEGKLSPMSRPDEDGFRILWFGFWEIQNLPSLNSQEGAEFILVWFEDDSQD